MDEARRRARRLAQEHISRGDPLGWFEPLYVDAEWDARHVQWADQKVNPHFAEWASKVGLRGEGRRALVVGCGLGDDAEELARRGFAVVAFDIAPSAIAWCHRRFPGSSVDYRVANLLDSPASWRGAFDFVLEVYTLQVLPRALQPRAMAQIASYVRPGGTVLVVTRGRDAEGDPGSMPWPLTAEDLAPFLQHGLREVAFEDFLDGETPPVRRFRVEYRA